MKPLKTMFLVLFLAMWVIGIALAGFILDSDAGSDDLLANRFGTVGWDHELHARSAVGNCQICHHTSKAGETNPPPCADCHKSPAMSESMHMPPSHSKEAALAAKMEGAEKPVPNRRTVFHKSCQGCHVAVKAGPTACRDCHGQKLPADGGAGAMDHIAYADDHSMRCTRCHAQGEPTRLVEGGWDDCAFCHSEGKLHTQWKGDKKTFDHKPLFRGSAGEVLWDHRRHSLEYMKGDKPTGCLTCHHKDKDLDPQEYRRCRDCHKSKDGEGVFEGKPTPARGKVLHAKCLACHDATDPELPDGMPSDCVDCHRQDVHGEVSSFGYITWAHDNHGMAAGVDCTYCHHMDTAEGPMRACKTCHFEGSAVDFDRLVEKTHTNCVSCHSATLPDAERQAKFAKINTCGACHKKWDETGGGKTAYAEKHVVLEASRVLHKLCWKCHEEKGQGPGSDSCRGCHAYPRERQLAVMARAKAVEEAEDSELPIDHPALPAADRISAEASAVHSIHINIVGTPCFDCHHNIKPTKGAAAKFAAMPKRGECKQVGQSLDDCPPALTDPQHCGNCHGGEITDIVDDTQARRLLCNDCHKEFGLEPPIR